AATNRDLESALEQGRFREDLYYRLKVVTIFLPSLRERAKDIPLLTDYFLARFSREARIENPGITEEAKAILSASPWQGNVRELSNTLQKALIFNRGAPISQTDISQAISGENAGKAKDIANGDQAIRQWVHQMLTSQSDENIFDACMSHFTGILISETLKLTGGNRSKAAKLLGLSRPTLHSRIEKYGIKFETSVTEGQK
ncbi:MAG: helix-turn-helix domain-containing protein, partial [Desulfobacterales bacterium]